MKEWLQEGGVSTDSAIGFDSDTIAQRENIFSDADCFVYYFIHSEWYTHSICKNNSMLYVTDSGELFDFSVCIIHHFMTEMGANNSCSDDSVRSDINTTVKNTITLLSKDRLLYNFMVDTLDAGNICQAVNDDLTHPSYICYWYIPLRKHGGSKCTYDTPKLDSDIQSYSDCLRYRFLESLGADINVCKDWTLMYKCNLFDFMKEWLMEGGVSADGAIVSDIDTTSQRENMFSHADCYDYRWTVHDSCKDNSILYVTDPEFLDDFFNCITHHFMTEMGASNSCSDDSVRSDINTTVKNTITLLSKDLFYNFLVDTLDAGNICQAVNYTVTLSADNTYCNMYIYYERTYHVRSRCEYNSHRIDTDRELSYEKCLYYRLMESLGADSVCQISLIENCDWYYNIVQSLTPTCICVFGLIGNLLSLCMLGSGAVETPIAYQLLWLASVDITFTLTWRVVEVLPEILRYYNGRYGSYALTPYQTSIVSVLTVCLRPLAYATRSCTVWLTVLIGPYRYLAVCKPYNNLTFHCTQHGHKYVILVVFLSFLYNIPSFCEYYIHYMYTRCSYIYDHFANFSGKGRFYDHYVNGSHSFYALMRTGLVSRELLDIYSRIHAALTVSLPCLTLFFVTVSILVELRKLKTKRSSMQTSQTSQNSITVMLITILITFIICQVPYFVWSGIGVEIHNADLDPLLDWRDEKMVQGCGSFMYYIRWLSDAGLLLHSSANGFIYSS